MYHIKCNDCGYSRDVSLFLEYADNKCLNCTSEDLEVTQTKECGQQDCEYFLDLGHYCENCEFMKCAIGDNFPTLPIYNELQEIAQIKLPKITKDDIDDLIIDLNLKKVTEIIGD